MAAKSDWCKHIEECECEHHDQDYLEPLKKKVCGKGKQKSTVEDEKIEEVVKRLGSIECNISVFDDLRKGYKCSICKLACKSPTVAFCSR